MRLLPRTLVGRAVLVVLAGLVISHLVSAFFYAGERASLWSDARGHYAAERVAAAVKRFSGLSVEERRIAVRRLRGPGLFVFWSEESAVAEAEPTDWRSGWFRRKVLHELDDYPKEAVRVGYADTLPSEARPSRPFGEGRWQRGPWWMHHEGGERMRHGPGRFFGAGAPLLMVSLQMPEGDWINFAVPAIKLTPFWASPAFGSIALTALVVLALSVWAVRRAARPLTMLAGAADRLGVDVNAPPVEEEGPREVVHAARAFNRMQERLRGFVEDRTRMLAAVSHDLRTPITRLRLRAEYMQDKEQQAKMLADLDEMEAMIAATLTFARDDAAAEERGELDLASLLRSLVDDATDAGKEARFDGPENLAFTGRPRALKRAFANLVDNATNYGEVAEVTLSAGEAEVTVTVEDRGPGIPEEERERVFNPFYRLEASRNRETGGTGLGLSVVRAAVRAHGGEVALTNRAEGGLRVTVTLPLAEA